MYFDLPTALTMGSKAFEKIRYSYEGISDDVQYYLQDLPQLLGYLILQMKPEWKALRRIPIQLEPAADQKPTPDGHSRP